MHVDDLVAVSVHTNTLVIKKAYDLLLTSLGSTDWCPSLTQFRTIFVNYGASPEQFNVQASDVSSLRLLTSSSQTSHDVTPRQSQHGHGYNVENLVYVVKTLGEVMLRLDPGEGRVRTARQFTAWEGGGEYNVARGLRRCFEMRTGVVTAFADNEIGHLIDGHACAGNCLAIVQRRQIADAAAAGQDAGAAAQRGPPRVPPERDLHGHGGGAAAGQRVEQGEPAQDLRGG